MQQFTDNKKLLPVLVSLSLLVLAAIYFSPIWWVSLKAPNYPPEAFPDGVRIHFHFDSVRNGCRKIQKKEIQESESLDCVHEMDTINHYVGMYPISTGGPIERALSPFLVGFLGVLVLGFAFRNKNTRTIVLSAGFIITAGLMITALHTDGGVKLFSDGYLASMQKTMDVDYEEIAHWSGMTAIKESYDDAMGMYFRDSAIISGKVATLDAFTNGVSIALIIAMIIIVIADRMIEKFYFVLALVPIFLPVFFVIDYAAWLWHFGHNLNAMGAFTVKPFMPTVFGDGKVAQFSTHSYPYWGFGLMLVLSTLMFLALRIRFKELAKS